MSKHSAFDYLSSIPLFADLSHDQLAAVGQASTELLLDAGQVLMREGDNAREMVVVGDGIIEVTRNGEHVADIGAGGFAGELGLLSGHPRNATVVTKTPVRLIHIDSRALSGLLADVPQLAVKLLPVVAERTMEFAATAP